MTDPPPRPPVSSLAWTGDQPVPPAALPRPPVDPARREEGVMAFLLMLLGGVLYAAWWVVLSFHSPERPDPASGHTEPLSLARHGGSIYVRETESLAALALALSAFVLPGIYLGWKAWRRSRRG